MQVVYWNTVTKSIETMNVRPETVQDAISHVKTLFASGVSTLLKYWPKMDWFWRTWHPKLSRF